MNIFLYQQTDPEQRKESDQQHRENDPARGRDSPLNLGQKL